MICEKTFTCSIEDIDGVFVEVAEEIKKGWSVMCIKHLDFEISCGVRLKPSFEVVMRRKEK